MSDFNQAVTSAQLRGARLVALFNDPDVVYKASEEEMLKRPSPDQRSGLNRWREAEMRTVWNNFWTQLLNPYPMDPTIFLPSSASLPWSFQDVLWYLFQIYDSKSSGLNSDAVFASEHSSTQYGALGPKLAILYNHLERKNCFNGSESSKNTGQGDNLVPWTSSLMNTIQRAIWRSHVGHKPASNVYICAVNTRKVPQGQFARDMWLLDTSAYPRSNWLRLENPEYDNREYLSQGVIHHGGRSSTFSLQDLVSSGLYKEYPEQSSTLKVFGRIEC
ncbi:unnamed protein product [Fusarium fujikuroi]|uniref:Uncharacterized protein n=1 Tax=Fusarium fujikuroi TaxID=5127 RepID=A0A9Q9REX6_FUSFU|nr:unnamed protein product [Fusarium fujikuroi]